MKKKENDEKKDFEEQLVLKLRNELELVKQTCGNL
jgi:hypothetical protein